MYYYILIGHIYSFPSHVSKVLPLYLYLKFSLLNCRWLFWISVYSLHQWQHLTTIGATWMVLPGHLTQVAIFAPQVRIVWPWFGTFNQCLGLSKIPFWRTQLRPRLIRSNGVPYNLIGFRSVIKIAWRYCAYNCEVGLSFLLLMYSLLSLCFSIYFSLYSWCFFSHFAWKLYLEIVWIFICQCGMFLDGTIWNTCK